MSLSEWHWEAGEVTHVIADANCYSSIVNSSRNDKHDHNELLYALSFAPLLSHNKMPNNVIREIAKGDTKYI